MFTGYILYKTKCKIRLRKTVNILGWTTATLVALLVVYGLWNPSDGGDPTLNNATTVLYNAVSRTAWGLCICWVILACAAGYGGPVNTFLSWPAFIPLSRLSYCAYLIHPLILLTYFGSKQSLLYCTDLEMAYMFTATLCLSYLVALVVSLAFEAPMMGLEKAILGRRRKR